MAGRTLIITNGAITINNLSPIGQGGTVIFERCFVVIKCSYTGDKYIFHFIDCYIFDTFSITEYSFRIVGMIGCKVYARQLNIEFNNGLRPVYSIWNMFLCKQIKVFSRIVFRNNIVKFLYNTVTPIIYISNYMSGYVETISVITDNLFIPYGISQYGNMIIREVDKNTGFYVLKMNMGTNTPISVMLANNIVVAEDDIALKYIEVSGTIRTVNNIADSNYIFSDFVLDENNNPQLCPTISTIRLRYLYRIRDTWAGTIMETITGQDGDIGVRGTSVGDTPRICNFYTYEPEQQVSVNYMCFVRSYEYRFFTPVPIDSSLFKKQQVFTVKLPYYNMVKGIEEIIVNGNGSYTFKLPKSRFVDEELVVYEGDMLKQIGIITESQQIITEELNYSYVEPKVISITTDSDDERTKLNKLSRVHIKYAFIDNVFYKIKDITIDNDNYKVEFENQLPIQPSGKVKIYESKLRFILIPVSEDDYYINTDDNYIYITIYANVITNYADLIESNSGRHLMLARSVEDSISVGIYDPVNDVTYPGKNSMKSSYADFVKNAKQNGLRGFSATVGGKDLVPYQLIGIQGDIDIINDNPVPTDYPSPELVRENVTYGSGRYVGNVKVPNPKTVLKGVEYDAIGISTKVGEFDEQKYKEEIGYREL